MFAALKGVKDIRVGCSLVNVAIPLDFTEGLNFSLIKKTATKMVLLGYKTGKLFVNASSEVTDILKSENSTYNLHRYCITKAVLKENNLLNSWQILSTNKDSNGVEFISALEHTDYPVYGSVNQKNHPDIYWMYCLQECSFTQKKISLSSKKEKDSHTPLTVLKLHNILPIFLWMKARKITILFLVIP